MTKYIRLFFLATHFWMELLQKQTAGLLKNIEQLRLFLSSYTYIQAQF